VEGKEGDGLRATVLGTGEWEGLDQRQTSKEKPPN